MKWQKKIKHNKGLQGHGTCRAMVPAEPQQVKQVAKKPQQVTTKDPKKVEAGKGLLQSIIKREK